MQHLEGSGRPVLYIGRTVLKVKCSALPPLQHIVVNTNRGITYVVWRVFLFPGVRIQCLVLLPSRRKFLHHALVFIICDHQDFASDVMTAGWRIPVIRNWKLGYVIQLWDYTLHQVPLFYERLFWNPTKTNPEPDLLYIYFFKPHFIKTSPLYALMKCTGTIWLLPGTSTVRWILLCTVKVKVKFTLEQATKAHRGSRGIALLFP